MNEEKGDLDRIHRDITKLRLAAERLGFRVVRKDPAPKRVITVRLEPGIHQALTEAHVADSVSQNAFCRALLIKELIRRGYDVGEINDD